VFEFKHLTDEDIINALKAAVKSRHKGLGKQNVAVDEDALGHIARMAGGDLRSAYNALELAALTSDPNSEGQVHITLSDAEQSIQKKSLAYNQDSYYDFLSAFCKSLRGSDANAALYYAMRLIEGGCDPMLVARRLVIHSAEDVGMADPRALQIATSALYALEKIGYPEAMIPLSEAIIYVCEAEKSNSVVEAMFAAKSDALNARTDTIPAYLKDNSFGSKEDKANGKQYKYPHDYGGYVEQQYLPDELKDKVYYTPNDRGYEQEVLEIRKRKGKKQ
jgi:putative ATPase